MKTELVHSSTHSHYVKNGVSVEAEKAVKAGEDTTIVHEEHDTLKLYEGNNEVGFVKTFTHSSGLIERVKD